MVFSSVTFLLYFLPLFLVVYHLMPKGFKNYFILFASLVFYTWGAPKFVILLVGSTIIDFYLVQWMHRSKNKKKRQLLLATSVSINVGLLLYFKYANFMVENINALLENFGAEPMTWQKVLLPIGISFYTFQTLTYSIDIYRKVHKPLAKLSNYLLYIMSFPQMIAGPIVRFNDIADQIIERKEKINDKLYGLFRFCIGLGKKVLLANPLGFQADLIMDLPPNEITTYMAWVGIVAYTFQIYFDFSGYSDMAIGLGRIMGFTFPENFNSPYISKSISEFWRRWHMTLGAWMRDYLYIPLGGSRVDSVRRLYFNLWFVFIISGLWHGAAWNFIIWGGFHGLFLILDRLFLVKFLNKLGKLPAIIFTFLVVMIGWVFFRIETFDSAIAFISKMFSIDNGSHAVAFVTEKGFYFYVVLAVICSSIGLFKPGKWLEQKLYFSETLSLRKMGFGIAISLVLFVLSLSFITSSGFNPFIYFRF